MGELEEDREGGRSPAQIVRKDETGDKNAMDMNECGGTDATMSRKARGDSFIVVVGRGARKLDPNGYDRFQIFYLIVKEFCHTLTH